MSTTQFTLNDLSALITEILVAYNTAPDVAATVAQALSLAEADGQKGHGASRVPSYAGQAASGKVDGHAAPVETRLGPAASSVDARDGFAYPALQLAQRSLRDSLAANPIAAVSIRNSHHSGVVAHHVEPLAQDGFIAISMGNGPHAIAPWGGNRGLFGTNPIGFAAPRAGTTPLIIDMSLSKVARGKVNVAAQQGQPIPDDWAFDADGAPTTDPKAALAGTMAPMGDAKGAQLVLMVEILAAALSASCFGFESSSYFEAAGAPPRNGQLLLAIDPGPFSHGQFADRLEVLLTAIQEQPGARLPGQRALTSRQEVQANGVSLPDNLVATLQGLRNGPT